MWGLVDLARGHIIPVRGTLADWAEELTSGRGEPVVAGDPIPLGEVELLPPVLATSTIAATGMNYWSHLEKLGVTERPASTVGFLKPRAALVGQDAEIQYPSITRQLDYEVELVAIVGQPDIPGHHRPSDAVLGYTIGNDVSARDTPSPMGGYDLFSMKALDRSTPLGPWITTRDEFGDGQPDVNLALWVNGELRQRDRTSNMLWSVDECLDYITTRTTLGPGDALFTGTTAGVAAEDGRWLQPGDVVECEIEHIGRLRNTVGPRRGNPRPFPG
jgi:2-keto-4-pentenoate hydratase/2-oxohepta-3-ene-1,7-dioic acid hydratase in catechol pathway